MPTLSPRPSRWLVWLPVWSLGILAFVSATAVAIEAGTRKAWQGAAGFLALNLVALLASASSDQAQGGFANGIVVVCGLTTMIGGPLFTLAMAKDVERRHLEGEAELREPSLRGRNRTAVAAVEDARQRRADAAQLALHHPETARELRIGRPDLRRDYDDGGLVDVNNAPSSVLVEHLDLSRTEAARVIEVREHLGCFKHLDDLVVMAHMDQAVCSTGYGIGWSSSSG